MAFVFNKFWFVLLFLPATCFGISQGPNSPTSGTDDASAGTVIWLHPGNITASDVVYSTSVLPAAGVTTHYLKALTFNFSIPARATISGIQLEINRHYLAGSGAPADVTVSLVRAGTIESTNKAGVGWATTDRYDSFGGASDLWSASWTPSDINDANFGAVLSTQWSGISGTTLSVDHYRMTVTYTLPKSGGGVLQQDYEN